MDARYRNLLRQWNSQPGDTDLAKQLNQEIRRMGGDLYVQDALEIRALAQEILTHFGQITSPTLYFASLRTSNSAVNQHVCNIINRAIDAANQHTNINPGESIVDATVLDLAHPIFLLMSEFGIYGPCRASDLPPTYTRCAICGRSDVPISGGLCFSEECTMVAIEGAVQVGPHTSRRSDDLRVYHAYRENLVLYDKQAQDYAALHGVPLQSGLLPRRVANNALRGGGGLDHPIWCYRLFNPEVFKIAVDIAGCQGDGSRRNRGCQQHRRTCICKDSLCTGCRHCRGCGYHSSQCVCAEFYYSEVGTGIAIDLHPLGYLCGCGGGGWNSTDYDSVHRCPYHQIASHHPECDQQLYNEAQGLPFPDVTECCDPPSPSPAQPFSPSAPHEDDLPF